MNPGTPITVNGNNFQTTNILTSDIDHNSSPEINAQILNIAHANAGSIPYIDWPKKVIPVEGELLGVSSLANLDLLQDTFKSYLSARNFNLDIGYGGSTRRYNCMGVTKIAITRPRNFWKCGFNVEFTCQAFGMDTSATTLVNVTGITTASATYTPTFGGSAPYQYPVYTLTLTTVGGSPVSGTVQIGNNANGQAISVTRTWTSGDTLVIDTTQLLNTLGASMPVTVNGVPVAFSGAFPEFPPGASAISYTDSFASRTYNLNISNTNRYL